MEGSRPAAVVIGIDSLQGLQTARILAARNIPVFAVAADRQHPACRTNVCQKIVFADTRSERLVAALLGLRSALSENPVLFPCQDDSVRVVSERRAQLAEDFAIALPDATAIRTLADKERFYAYAAERGFPIPATVVLRDREDAVRVSKRLRYPAVLKPSFRSPKWNAGTASKAFKANDEEELLDVYERYRHLAPALLVQEWIEGSDSDLYACNCYFGADSQPLAAFVTRKLRQWPPVMGSSCCGEEARNDVVLETALKLFRTFPGYRGLAYLEMKRHAGTGQLFIIEPNVGRPTGRSALAEAGGVELLLTMYCDALGLSLPVERTQTYRGVRWLDIRHDLQAAAFYLRRRELTVGELIESWRGRKVHAVFSWRDPAPFFWDIKRSIGKVRFRPLERGRQRAGAVSPRSVEDASR